MFRLDSGNGAEQLRGRVQNFVLGPESVEPVD